MLTPPTTSRWPWKPHSGHRQFRPLGLWPGTRSITDILTACEYSANGKNPVDTRSDRLSLRVDAEVSALDPGWRGGDRLQGTHRRMLRPARLPVAGPGDGYRPCAWFRVSPAPTTWERRSRDPQRSSVAMSRNAGGNSPRAAALSSHPLNKHGYSRAFL